MSRRAMLTASYDVIGRVAATASATAVAAGIMWRLEVLLDDDAKFVSGLLGIVLVGDSSAEAGIDAQNRPPSAGWTTQPRESARPTAAPGIHGTPTSRVGSPRIRQGAAGSSTRRNSGFRALYLGKNDALSNSGRAAWRSAGPKSARRARLGQFAVNPSIGRQKERRWCRQMALGNSRLGQRRATVQGTMRRASHVVTQDAMAAGEWKQYLFVAKENDHATSIV